MYGSHGMPVGALTTASGGGTHGACPPATRQGILCTVALHVLPQQRVCSGPSEARHSPRNARTELRKDGAGMARSLRGACSLGCCARWNGQREDRRMGDCIMLPNQALHFSGSLSESAS